MEKLIPITIFALLAITAWYIVSGNKRKTPAVKAVSFYGASITRGDGLKPRPVERRTELAKGAFIGVDYSLGGSTVQDATTGDPRLPYSGPFYAWIKQDTSDIVVIDHSGANSLHCPDIDAYDMLLTGMINDAKASGKTVVLSGMTQVAYPVPGLSDSDSTRKLAVLAAFDDRTEAIAIREGCEFLDVRSVPFRGPVDMMPDGIHPSQDYSDRVSAYVTARLVALIEAG